MKAFHFTLEAVQTLRQRQEQQAMEQYVRALLARQQVERQLEIIREQIAANQRELQRKLSAGCTASLAAQIHSYERLLEKQQDEGVAKLGQAEQRVNAALQAMLAARQRRKMVEIYRAKQLAGHQRHELREEQKLLDDLAGRRARPLFSLNPNEGAA